MPRGAKGQRELMEKMEAMVKANPGMNAVDALKKIQGDLTASGVLKPPTDLSDESKKILDEVIIPELKEKKLQILATPAGYKIRRKLEGGKPRGRKPAKKE